MKVAHSRKEALQHYSLPKKQPIHCFYGTKEQICYSYAEVQKFYYEQEYLLLNEVVAHFTKDRYNDKLNDKLVDFLNGKDIASLKEHLIVNTYPDDKTHLISFAAMCAILLARKEKTDVLLVGAGGVDLPPSFFNIVQNILECSKFAMLFGSNKVKREFSDVLYNGNTLRYCNTYANAIKDANVLIYWSFYHGSLGVMSKISYHYDKRLFQQIKKQCSRFDKQVVILGNRHSYYDYIGMLLRDDYANLFEKLEIPFDETKASCVYPQASSLIKKSPTLYNAVYLQSASQDNYIYLGNIEILNIDACDVKNIKWRLAITTAHDNCYYFMVYGSDDGKVYIKDYETYCGHFLKMCGHIKNAIFKHDISIDADIIIQDTVHRVAILQHELNYLNIVPYDTLAGNFNTLRQTIAKKQMFLVSEGAWQSNFKKELVKNSYAKEMQVVTLVNIAFTQQ